jgi:MoxR-like ATPase
MLRGLLRKPQKARVSFFTAVKSRKMYTEGTTTVTKIADVHLKVRSSGASHLIPKGYLEALSPMSPEILGHFRWLAQKFSLKQDSLFLGHPGPIRRQIIFAFAEACNLEVEYLRLTRDTTESDLKQRRELSARDAISGQSVEFHNQAPVRAALNGRLLVLEGLEAAERNVLPTLNNLLENREMHLEEGVMLGSASLPVDEQFRVIALALQSPPYTNGNALDPPLRSRFQSRFVDNIAAETSLTLLEQKTSSVSEGRLKSLLRLQEALRSARNTALEEGLPPIGLPQISIKQMEYCLGNDIDHISLAHRVERCLPVLTWMKTAVPPRLRPMIESAWEDLTANEFILSTVKVEEKIANNSKINNNAISLTREQNGVLSRLVDDSQRGRHLCLLGPRGSGKSELARALGANLSMRINTFPMYAELTARDILQRRQTDETGGTSWADTPLTSSIRNGELCVLDGIDRADPHSLVVLQSLTNDGVVALPSGELLRAHPDFRLLSLGQFNTSRIRSDDLIRRYVGSEIDWNYHLLSDMSVSDMFSALKNESNALKGTDVELLQRAVTHLNKAASDIPELKLHLRHLLRVQRLGFNTDGSMKGLRNILADSLLTRFLPIGTNERFNQALDDANVPKTDTLTESASEKTSIIIESGQLKIGDVSITQRTPKDSQRVPSPLFYENEQHSRTLQSMLLSLVRGEKSILLVGNQGVGKNKLVDRLLQLMNAERDYVQLHRDSTIQSLTLTPSLEGGKISYQPSVVVQAALAGHVLVVDEADKAPIEVVTVLKGLAEDGELMLPDGSRLLHRDVWLRGRPSEASVVIPFSSEEEKLCADENVLLVHDDFRMMVLANRPGMPFLGNNFFRECGDVFHTFVVDNLPLESELALLRAYAPDVPDGVLRRLAVAFGSLRNEYDSGRLNYPYSAREAVAVVKHIQMYPADGALAAIENILQFENLSPSTRARVASTFQECGIPVPSKPGSSTNRPPVKLTVAAPSPAPQEFPLHYVSSSLDIQWKSAIPLNSQLWQGEQVTKQHLDIRSSRVHQFSEEVAALRVGRPEDVHSHRQIEALVGGKNSLHALTTVPLEVHSYLGIRMPGQQSTNNEPGSYIRHELLSANMGWRLGKFHPLLVPGGESCCTYVIIPELSMAIRVPGEATSPTMLPLPGLKEFFATDKSKTSLTASLFGQENNRENAKSLRVSYDAKLCSDKFVLWRGGSSRVALLDMGAGNLHYAETDPSNAFDSVTLLEGNILLRTLDGSMHSMSLPSSGGNKVVHLQGFIDCGGQGPNAAIQSYSGISGFNLGATSNTFATSLSTKGTSHVKQWPRAKLASEAITETTTDNQPLRVMRSTPGDNQIHTLATKTESSDGPFLEVGAMQKSFEEPLMLRRIPLQGNDEEDRSASALDMALMGDDCGAAILFSDGIIRLYETDEASLTDSLLSWETMHGPDDNRGKDWEIARVVPSAGSNPTNGGLVNTLPLGNNGRFADQPSTPKTGTDAPKHGKEDEKNEPHHGGNTWAGGSGGSDTAGLGGRGGPYRLDKGHTVHQVSDAAKAAVSDEARESAERMGKEALRKRLDDISLGKGSFEAYLEYRDRVRGEIASLQNLMDEIARRAKERVWLRRQSHGELDDTRLVDGLTGDRLVFKRRGSPDSHISGRSGSSSGDPTKKRLQFVVDVSGSMYRFNGQDRRLERLMEAVLLVLESLPQDLQSPLQYALSGHSGDSPDIRFIEFDDPKPENEAEKYKVLESMVAHSQYCLSGDYTVRAMEMAINNVVEDEDETGTERYVFVVSDANFERYGIDPQLLERIMLKDKRVNAHLILIASLGGEAERIKQEMPGCNDRVHTCYDTSALPLIFQKVLLEAIMGESDV